MERSSPGLDSSELSRYARHLSLPEIGREGQIRLKRARVLVVGAGGLGSPLALYLAAAGIGTLGLVDFDDVDETNLQRQILHGTKDVGRPKLDSARDRLADVNPNVTVVTYPVRLGHRCPRTRRPTSPNPAPSYSCPSKTQAYCPESLCWEVNGPASSIRTRTLFLPEPQ